MSFYVRVYGISWQENIKKSLALEIFKINFIEFKKNKNELKSAMCSLK